MTQAEFTISAPFSDQISRISYAIVEEIAEIHLLIKEEPTELEKSDFNGDGVIDSLDFILLTEAWMTSDPKYDLDGNGIVDTADYAIWVQHYGKTVGD